MPKTPNPYIPVKTAIQTFSQVFGALARITDVSEIKNTAIRSRVKKAIEQIDSGGGVGSTEDRHVCGKQLAYEMLVQVGTLDRGFDANFFKEIVCDFLDLQDRLVK